MPSKKSSLLQFPPPAEPEIAPEPEPPSPAQCQSKSVVAAPEYGDRRSSVLELRLDFEQRKSAIYQMYLAATDSRRYSQAKHAIAELRRDIREEMREQRAA
jgi:hypothetical protein